MSFHKRWLNKENILQVYEDRGLLGLEKYIGGADTLITSDTLSSNIVDVLLSEKLNLPEKWDKITQLILKEKNERKETTI
tara:strand:+ start:367 stop:606 length:240 start_codon:yes stop_codon:yes gene_type:complete